MNYVIVVLGAIAAGMVVQGFFALRQANAFSRSLRALRAHGSVSVGGAGRRYGGGKAFVAIAADDSGVVTKAITLKGWTTFARPGELSAIHGIRLSRLRRDEPIANVSARERTAIQNAAETLQKHLAKTA